MSKKISKQKKQKQKQKSVTAQLLKGKLEVTRSGMGYVVIDNGSGDVLVRPGDFMNALNGDVVRVKWYVKTGEPARKKARSQK
jgi:ribonuclease R